MKAKGKKKEGVKVRRARLRLVHVRPWSVMKLSFLLSVALGIVTVVAVAIVWDMLGRTGLWDSINSTVGQVVNSGTGPTFDIRNYVGTNRVLGLTMVDRSGGHRAGDHRWRPSGHSCTTWPLTCSAASR